jgi:hypothetical protein
MKSNGFQTFLKERQKTDKRKAAFTEIREEQKKTSGQNVSVKASGAFVRPKNICLTKEKNICLTKEHLFCAFLCPAFNLVNFNRRPEILW